MSDLPQLDLSLLAGRRVLVRADLNVPLDGDVITDITRIDRFLPTVDALRRAGAIVIIITHLGRPGGKTNPTLSTLPIANALREKLGSAVLHAKDCVGQRVEKLVGDLANGDVLVLENVRFHQGETENSAAFALRLSVLGDYYVNDAFSCAHRAHASTHAITNYLPSFAGPSLIAEIEALEKALEKPAKPVAALVGGAKISTKIPVLLNLIPRIDYLIIGGGMANTFLAAKGRSMGKSLYEEEAIDAALDVMVLAQELDCKLVLPEDLVVAKEFKSNASNRTVDTKNIGDDEMALDLGSISQHKIVSVLEKCKTLLWNGPLGAFEIEPFDGATSAVARAAAYLTKQGELVTIAGGGDTVAALNNAGVTADFTYVSTAGGAFLEWLEGKKLPGIAALYSTEQMKQEA